jgi:hypothetical protein
VQEIRRPSQCRARWRGGSLRLPCPVVKPPKPAAPFQFLVLLVAGWIHRRQQLAIAYLQAENRVLRERFGTGRLRLTDAERRLLAEKGQGLGRTLLAELATLATPETILRWYRRMIAAKYDGSDTRRSPTGVLARPSRSSNACRRCCRGTSDRIPAGDPLIGARLREPPAPP